MNNLSSLFGLLLLDIETVPQQYNFESLSDEWKFLWKEKFSKTMPESVSPEEGYNSRAAILAEFGKVICISTAYFFENENKQLSLKVKSIYGDNEAELLRQFININDKVYNRNKQFLYAGHNIKEFDIPYLCRRMLINQVILPKYLQLHGAKPWEVKMVDTMQWWKFGDYKNFISLNLLANVLGVPTSKTDIDGSKVQQVYYEEKNLKRIVEYCEKDVVVVANILLRFNNLSLLEANNIIISA